MSDPISLDSERFVAELRGIKRSAFRLELQAAYAEPMEAESLQRFASGDPLPPTEVEGLVTWFDHVAALTAAGMTYQRVRVHNDPPTLYQQWERWVGRWNIDAGEDMRYLTRQKGFEIGLLPAAGDIDWWLLDNRLLITMEFDAEGRRIRTELTDDQATMEQARAWRDLAVQHGVPDSGSAIHDPRI
jgi:hypothetical protein